jgi:PAS domain S-box-containing protein
MNKAPVGITIADITLDDEPLIYVNDGFIDITGYERRDTIGQNCRFLQGKDTRDKPTSKMRNAINNEETVTVEIQNYKKDGSKFWNRITLGPIYDENNELTHYIGFQEDISNLKNIKKKKMFLRNMLKHQNSLCLSQIQIGILNT